MLTSKEQETFGKLLNKLHDAVYVVPDDIKNKAQGMRKFCTENLPSDGKEWEFPIGHVTFEIRPPKVGYGEPWFNYEVRVHYTFHWSCAWHSVYHNDSVRSETAFIRGLPVFNFGLNNPVRLDISLDK